MIVPSSPCLPGQNLISVPEDYAQRAPRGREDGDETRGEKETQMKEKLAKERDFSEKNDSQKKK